MNGRLFVFVYTLLALCPGFLCAPIHAQSAETSENETAVEQLSVAALLSGYLKNNLNLKKLASSVEKAYLSADSTAIKNGLTFKMQTGEITIKTGETIQTSFKPNATLLVPQADNLGVNLSSQITLSADKKTVENTALSFSADIISGSRQTRAVALLESRRAILEAQRTLQDGFENAEKEFYSQLRSLYVTAVSLVSAQQDLYDDAISFEEIKAQGYMPSSSKYRSAQMKVVSDEHTVETHRHELERQTKIFAQKCGVLYTGSDALQFLPSLMPQVEPVDVHSFDRAMFAKTENASWIHSINSQKRDAEKALVVTGNAGYTFNNTTTDSDSVDVGSSLKWHDTALAVSGGVSLPVAAEHFWPAYTFSVSLDPNAFRQAKITDKLNSISDRQESIDIATAELDYETAVITQETALSDILWNKSKNKESYELYAELEKDTAEWYKQGIVTESEWKSALVNKEKFRIQCIINEIELIMYNNETRLLFCRDEELNEKPKEVF